MNDSRDQQWIAANGGSTLGGMIVALVMVLAGGSFELTYASTSATPEPAKASTSPDPKPDSQELVKECPDGIDPSREQTHELEHPRTDEPSVVPNPVTKPADPSVERRPEVSNDVDDEPTERPRRVEPANDATNGSIIAPAPSEHPAPSEQAEAPTTRPVAEPAVEEATKDPAPVAEPKVADASTTENSKDHPRVDRSTRHAQPAGFAPEDRTLEREEKLSIDLYEERGRAEVTRGVSRRVAGRYRRQIEARRVKTVLEDYRDKRSDSVEQDDFTQWGSAVAEATDGSYKLFKTGTSLRSGLDPDLFDFWRFVFRGASCKRDLEAAHSAFQMLQESFGRDPKFEEFFEHKRKLLNELY
ncbi:MAG: hypothetical protein AAF488_16955 [Planctomycetota bacterium]